MKKSVLLMAGVCLLSGMAAFADPVTSVNAVGVTKIDLPAGYSLLACPFNSVGGQALSLDDMLGTNLPDGSYVYLFVPGSGYVTYLFVGGAGWYNAELGEAGGLVGSDKILRGDGFWIYLPSAVSGLALAGEVPASAIGTNRIDLVTGYQLVSFAFPQEMALSASGLVSFDSDYIFKYSNGRYQTYINVSGVWYDAELGEGGGPVDIVFKPNEGFWYLTQQVNTNTWTQIKTYQWP